jgi:transcriptional regulator with XRE-family HTH domain
VTTGIDIKVARIRAQLTQKELAELLYCDRAIVSRMETGKMRVSEERLRAIAEITGIQLTSGSTQKA